MTGVTGGYPVVSIPPAPYGGTDWRTRARALAVVVGVLVLALAGTGTWLLIADGHLRHDLAKLDAAAARRAQDQADAKTKLTEQFRQADLSGKLDKVRTLTQQTRTALLSWDDGGQPLSGLKTLRDLGNKCDEAVIDYDGTAAQFPVEMLAGLPIRIDVTDEATDCAR
ncbi:hypothetical protein [Rugosimonospora africana]|nr:hypothetical protein [Rugosimonospora africana]